MGKKEEKEGKLEHVINKEREGAERSSHWEGRSGQAGTTEVGRPGVQGQDLAPSEWQRSCRYGLCPAQVHIEVLMLGTSEYDLILKFKLTWGH